MADVVAFVGPSLHRLDDARRARLLSGIEPRPPAKRGDVISALADGPHTLVLIDGYFHSELSVAHKELLVALQAGIRVIGGASMGALRAAEMSAFGMMGAGEVFEWYAGGVVDGDDEVAVMHLPESHGYTPHTLALVELRYALGQLVQSGKTTGRDADALLDAVKRFGFSERTPLLVRDLAGTHLGVAAAGRLMDALDSFSLKEQDAIHALALAKTPYARREAAALDPSMFFTFWYEDHLRPPKGTRSLPKGATLLRGLHMVQLFHPAAPAFISALRLRFLAASAAERAGLEPSPSRLNDLTEELDGCLRDRHGGPVLPPWDVRAEARIQALARAGCKACGGGEAAGDWLAAEFGLDSVGGHQELIRLLASQYGRFPSRSLARSFAFSPALRPALELAEASSEVYDCFAAWSEGARISAVDRVALASQVWQCDPANVPDEAVARGLLESHGFSVGLVEVLQRAAPAERLPRPINRYPDLKASLQACPLDLGPLALPPGLPDAEPALKPRRPPAHFPLVGGVAPAD